MEENEIKEKVCNRKFKMGENVYMSKREIASLVRMKTDGDDYVRKMIKVFVIIQLGEKFESIEKENTACGIYGPRESTWGKMWRRM